jgi:hypothetical protein
LFFKILGVTDSGQASLRKGERVSQNILAGTRVTTVASLPPATPAESGVDEARCELDASDPLLDQAKSLLSRVGDQEVASPKKSGPSPVKTSKDKEREMQVLRRRQAISAQGGEFGVFAVGTDKGSVTLLRECASSSQRGGQEREARGVSTTVEAEKAAYDVLCTLDLGDLAQHRNHAGSFKTNIGWSPLPSSLNSVTPNDLQPPELGSITVIAFDARSWDESCGTCRLAVGTEHGFVLVCEASKGGGGDKLCQEYFSKVSLLFASFTT